MPGPLQLETPTVLEYFATLVADDDSLSLIESAISVAQDEQPQLDTQSVLAEIDGLILKLARRLPADASQLHKLHSLNHFFFDELGFAGNVNDYCDPGNSLISTVLRTRRGIPISLAIVYMELANGIGLVARGVSFPGHFMVKLRMPEGEVVIDPFTGHSLSVGQLDELLQPYRHRHGVDGEFEAPLGLFLQAAPARDILARMLRNLKEIYRNCAGQRSLLSVLDRLVILLPQAWDERRDRGLIHAEMANYHAAIEDLSTYLLNVTDAADHALLTARVAELKKINDETTRP